MPWTAEKIKQMREERVANGLCSQCGKERGSNGTVKKCRACADVSKVKTAKSRAKLGYVPKIFICKDGKCVTCGHMADVIKDEFQGCELCCFKLLASMYLGTRRRWPEIKDIWERQGGICPYTGMELEFGIDASLDHIQPSSRFPELAQDISNLEFVHYRVNEMKRDWTKEEFIEFLELLHMNLELKGDTADWWKSK